MREILFRGKRIDNGEWVVGDLIHRQIWNCSLTIIRVSDDGFDHYEEFEVKPETVGEFTNLTDKNGKKIFEGDIMQLCSACYPCLVYWDGKGWAWKQNGKRREIDLTREKMDTIGNIYDNKELLK